MRIFATLAAFGLLLGAVAVLPAKADCRTTCNTFAGQTTCNTHCF